MMRIEADDFVGKTEKFLNLVQDGETVQITRNGDVVAELRPPVEKERRLDDDMLRRMAGEE